ncbi:hypothetical protein SABIM44S_02966 [Streptomyces abikoensis]
MDTPASFHPRDLLLAAETVSPSNHSDDYTRKMSDHPAMGIPVFRRYRTS